MTFFKNVKTAEQIEAERIYMLAMEARAKRDRLIKETDFYLMPDYPAVPVGITEYRQSLRDITDQDGFPVSIEWPAKPTGGYAQ